MEQMIDLLNDLMNVGLFCFFCSLCDGVKSLAAAMATAVA